MFTPTKFCDISIFEVLFECLPFDKNVRNHVFRIIYTFIMQLCFTKNINKYIIIYQILKYIGWIYTYFNLNIICCLFHGLKSFIAVSIEIVFFSLYN